LQSDYFKLNYAIYSMLHKSQTVKAVSQTVTISVFHNIRAKAACEHIRGLEL